MPWFIPVAQGFKIIAWLAQAAVALWFATRSQSTRANMAFALALGTNGLAFAIWNFGRPGLRTPQSLGLKGRGVQLLQRARAKVLLDWIAALAFVLFALFFLVLPLILAAVMLVSDIYKARDYHLDVLAFGGLAIYVSNTFALTLLALTFAAELREEARGPCAVFSASLSINYADHIGASLIRSGAAPPATIQLGAMRWGFGGDVAIEVVGMLVILGGNFRAWNKSRTALAVVLCLVVSSRLESSCASQRDRTDPCRNQVFSGWDSSPRAHCWFTRYARLDSLFRRRAKGLALRFVVQPVSRRLNHESLKIDSSGQQTASVEALRRQ